MQKVYILKLQIGYLIHYLLIVVDLEAYDEEKYTRLLNRLTEEPDGRKGKDLVRVITELELTNLDTAAFRNRLAIHA